MKLTIRLKRLLFFFIAGLIAGLVSFVFVGAGIFVWWPENKLETIIYGISGIIGTLIMFYILHLIGIFIF